MTPAIPPSNPDDGSQHNLSLRSAVSFRSRTGCKECRQVKKKCDEALPACGRCLSRSQDCTFDRPAGIRHRNKRRKQVPESSLDSSRTTRLQHRVQSTLPERVSFERDASTIAVCTQSTPQVDYSTSAGPLQTESANVSGSWASLSSSRNNSIWDLIEPDQDISSSSFDHLLLDQLFQEFLLPAEDCQPTDFRSLAAGTQTSVTSAAAESAQSQATFPNHPSIVRQRLGLPFLDPSVTLADIIPGHILNAIDPSDLRLIQHFVEAQSPTSIACETENNPLRRLLLPIALSVPSEGNLSSSPAYQALLGCAATHRANLLASAGRHDNGQLLLQARTFRAKAYTSLAPLIDSYALSSPETQERLACTLCLLTHIAVLDGNPRLLPALYDEFSLVIAKKPKGSFSPREVFFFSLCSLWQTWMDFSRLATGEPAVEPLWDFLPFGDPQDERDLTSIFGIPCHIFRHWLTLFRLIRRSQTAVTSGRPAARIPVYLDAEELDDTMSSLYAAALMERNNTLNVPSVDQRILNGRMLHQLSLRILLQSEVLQVPRESNNIQKFVAEAIVCLNTFQWGTEAGSMIPLLILATVAEDRDRVVIKDFIQRCCWKGNAGPRAVAAVVNDLYSEGSKGWRMALLKVGNPMIV